MKPGSKVRFKENLHEYYHAEPNLIYTVETVKPDTGQVIFRTTGTVYRVPITDVEEVIIPEKVKS